MDLFKLVGSVFIDTEEANKSIAKTDKNAEGLGNKLSSGIKTAGKWAMGLGAAAGAVGGAMLKSAKDTSANLDEIDKASQRMKINAESYQELAHAAELSGVEMSTLEKAAKKLEGTGLNLDDALEQIYSFETAEERASVASMMFGDAVAYQMTPMLNASAEEMENMRQEANDLGLVMSEDAVKAGADMNDAFSKVQESMGALANQVGTAVMPIISELLQWVLDHMPEIQAFVGNAIAFIQSGIQQLIPIIQGLEPIISKVFEVVGNLWESVLKPVLTGIIEFLGGVFTGDWQKVFQGLSDFVSGIFNGLIGIIKAPLNAIIGLLNKAISGFNKIKIPDWVPGVGGKGLNIPEIPMLAKGGNITASGQAIVGEAGPELINLPTGASVTPLSNSAAMMDSKTMYEVMKSAFSSALSEVGIELTLGANSSVLFDEIIAQNTIYKNRHGGASAMV